MPRQRGYAKCASERCYRQVETSNMFKKNGGGRREEPRREEARRGGEEELRRHIGAATRARWWPIATFRARRGEAPGKYTWRGAGAARAEATGPRADGLRNKENPAPSAQRHLGYIKNIMQDLMRTTTP